MFLLFLLSMSTMSSETLSASIRCKSGQSFNYDLNKGSVTFTNPDIHEEAFELNCAIHLKQSSRRFCQVKVYIDELDLLQPDERGNCQMDKLEFSGENTTNLPVLCGHEPIDNVDIDGVETNWPNAVYVPLTSESKEKLTIRVTTTGKLMARKFRLRLEPIKCDSPELAPPGCQQFYTAEDSPIVVRSFNYPHGSPKLTSAFMICFGGADIEHIKLSPTSFGTTDEPFKLGQKSLKSARNGKCVGHQHLALAPPTKGSKSLKFCGGALNEKSGQSDGTVQFSTVNGQYFMRITSGPEEGDERASFRLLVNVKNRGKSLKTEL